MVETRLQLQISGLPWGRLVIWASQATGNSVVG